MGGRGRRRAEEGPGPLRGEHCRDAQPDRHDVVPERVTASPARNLLEARAADWMPFPCAPASSKARRAGDALVLALSTTGRPSMVHALNHNTLEVTCLSVIVVARKKCSS